MGDVRKISPSASQTIQLTTSNEQVGETYMHQDLRIALTATLRYCPVLVAEPERRIAAIVDFTFSLGAGRLQTSTLMRQDNQRDWHGAGKELRRWDYGGGEVLLGLVARREAEVALLIAEVKISS